VWTVCLLAILTPARPLRATEKELERLRSIVPDAPRFDCLTCHAAWRDERRRKVEERLNPFGRDYRRERRSRSSTLNGLLDRDSDGDGVSNRDELFHSARPGVSSSTPSSAPAGDPASSEIDLDPEHRLAEFASHCEQSKSEFQQRRGTYIRFLLALLNHDTKTIADLLANKGYAEIGRNAGLNADDLVQAWQTLNVSLPRRTPLDRIILCRQAHPLTLRALRLKMPDLSEDAPGISRYGLIALTSPHASCVTDEPLLFMDREKGRWKVTGGNVLSCWVSRPAASQPAGVTTRPASQPADPAMDPPPAASQSRGRNLERKSPGPRQVFTPSSPDYSRDHLIWNSISSLLLPRSCSMLNSARTGT
jgi:hypothetical protein